MTSTIGQRSELEKFGYIDACAIANRMIDQSPAEMKDKGILIVSLQLYRTLRFRKFNRTTFTYMRAWQNKQRALFTVKDNLAIGIDSRIQRIKGKAS